ncbi:hypothetical protein, partial [Escherichia coli]|uniref:hypothetical protein n=1 Tax=Escherichia coli TaxID=562 RepID=UPI001CDACFAC
QLVRKPQVELRLIVFAVHHQCLTKWVEWHRKTYCTNQQSYRFGMQQIPTVATLRRFLVSGAN